MAAENSVRYQCTECGARSPLDSVRCDECGEMSYEKEVTDSAGTADADRSAMAKVVWWLGGIAAVLIILGVGTLIFLLGYLSGPF